MKKRRILLPLAIVAFLYLVYGVIISRAEIQVLPPTLDRPHPDGFYDYKGVTQIHSDRSTGSRPVEEIVEIAKNSGLDFLFFTDSNLFENNSFDDGYKENLLVLYGNEYSYLDSRIIKYGGEKTADIKSVGQAQVFLADVLSQKNRAANLGTYVLAHPFKPGYEWSGEFPVGLDGVEVLNLRSLWENAWLKSKASVFWTMLVLPFNPRLAYLRLIDSPEREVQLWDTLNKSRPTTGLAGSDAESRARLYGRGQLEFPSYETLFSIVQNHLLLTSELTGHLESDRRKVVDAIDKGQFYFSIDMLADPKGFLTYLKNPRNEKLPLGTRTPYKSGYKLVVKLPIQPTVPFEVLIFRNGDKILTSNSLDTEIPLTSPGAYRATVRLIPTFPIPDGRKWITWIFTNHFYLTTPGAAGVRP